MAALKYCCWPSMHFQINVITKSNKTYFAMIQLMQYKRTKRALQKRRLTWWSGVSTGSHEFLGRDFVLGGDQFVNCVLVFQEDLHADERLATLLGEHVPRLGTGQQVGHGTLRQAQHRFAEQPLADRILTQLFFYLHQKTIDNRSQHYWLTSGNQFDSTLFDVICWLVLDFDFKGPCNMFDT